MVCLTRVTKILGQKKYTERKIYIYDGGPYHIETNPLICRTNQWTGFYMIGTSVLKEFKGKKANDKSKIYLLRTLRIVYRTRSNTYNEVFSENS